MIIGTVPPPSYQRVCVCVYSMEESHFSSSPLFFPLLLLLLTCTEIKSAKFVMNRNLNLKLITDLFFRHLTGPGSSGLARGTRGHRVRASNRASGPSRAFTGHRFPPGCRGAGGWSRGRKLPSRPGRALSGRRSGWWRDAPSWALGCVSADTDL